MGSIAIVSIEGDEEDQSEDRKAEGSEADDGGLPDGVNADFWKLYFGGLDEKHEKHMRGKKHAGSGPYTSLGRRMGS